MTNLNERMLPDPRIEPTAIRMPGRHAADQLDVYGSVNDNSSFIVREDGRHFTVYVESVIVTFRKWKMF